ncbi:gluconate 2-dehydrogenase subunit 3 family protein [Pseudochryseolinea flava]|uniref:Gluconate 2-dehydrogenase subunit 3 family protein n=1 Tax=Pseudochryseolinea flava TaxID=2059302 RepID=A0A364XY47_9BACT|nr:gluconate 2-dehydrogenase subunit 3 family protein [Pseudochryseolinea flava]RAV99231.1 hypothetical protein DQQ10_20240 [Pseudochryseolinea flava]
MKRRMLLKQLGLLAGAAVVLPHCTGKETAQEATISLHKLKITGHHQNSVTALVDALIPKTDTPGAKELDVQSYVWRMVDDCTSEEDQKKFLAGLDHLTTIADDRFGKTIAECSAADLQTLLQEMNDGKITEKNVGDFYQQFRRHTIRGFVGTESVMTNVYHYNMIPGHFTGVVEIKDPNDLKVILG